MSWRLMLLAAMLLGVVATGTAATSGEQLAAAAGRPLVGTAAPPLVLTTVDGRAIDLRRLYGRQAVYLKFWATWCVPCREQMPHFERTFEQAGPDLAVIAINAGFNDSVQDIAAYQRELGLRMPMVRDDGSLAAAFHLRVTPQHVVIGRDGRILHIGHLADARLEAALAAARTASLPSPGAAPGAAAAVAAAQRYRIGETLPAVNVATVDGPSIALRDPAGSRPTVLIFLSPWCESYLATSRPGRAADCRLMRERVAAAAGRTEIRWLGIAAGLWATPQDLRRYRREHRVAIPLALDETGELFRSFEVADVPAAFAVDPNGRLRRRLAPADLATAAAFVQAIEAP